MPYLGNSPASNFASVTKDTFSGNGSTTSFTLSKAATTNGVAVYVENVRQIPTTAYTVSGTTLDFGSGNAPVSGTNNIYVMHHNTPASTATHPSTQALQATSGTFTADVGLGTTTPATSLEISGTTENTQGGVFPRIQITTTADNNPTYSGSLDIVEKQSSATSSAVLGTAHVYGFRMMLDGFNNILKWFSASQTTVTERMGLDRDTGNLTLNTGNLIMGTSGKGIDFSATGDGSGTDSSELLDDYEEGTWTPTATAYGGTFSASDAQYVKVGRMVHFDCVLSFSGTDSDRVTIAGLPYTATNTSAVAKYFSGSAYSDLMMLVSGTTIVGANTSGDATYTSVSGMTARFSGTYMATA